VSGRVKLKWRSETSRRVYSRGGGEASALTTRVFDPTRGRNPRWLIVIVGRLGGAVIFSTGSVTGGPA